MGWDLWEDPGYACERLAVPQNELINFAGEREVWLSLLGLLPLWPDPGLRGWEWMHGWMDGLLAKTLVQSEICRLLLAGRNILFPRRWNCNNLLIMTLPSAPAVLLFLSTADRFLGSASLAHGAHRVVFRCFLALSLPSSAYCPPAAWTNHSFMYSHL